MSKISRRFRRALTPDFLKIMNNELIIIIIIFCGRREQ